MHNGCGLDLEVKQGSSLLGLEHTHDRVTGEEGSGVADLHGELHGGHAGLQVADHGGTNDHRDHAHIQASVEGDYELYACRVEEGYMVARVEVELVCDVSSHTLSSLVEGPCVDGPEGMTLHNTM